MARGGRRCEPLREERGFAKAGWRRDDRQLRPCPALEKLRESRSRDDPRTWSRSVELGLDQLTWHDPILTPMECAHVPDVRSASNCPCRQPLDEAASEDEEQQQRREDRDRHAGEREPLVRGVERREPASGRAATVKASGFWMSTSAPPKSFQVNTATRTRDGDDPRARERDHDPEQDVDPAGSVDPGGIDRRPAGSCGSSPPG